MSTPKATGPPVGYPEFLSGYAPNFESSSFRREKDETIDLSAIQGERDSTLTIDARGCLGLAMDG
jgi:hypothetical protein